MKQLLVIVIFIGICLYGYWLQKVVIEQYSEEFEQENMVDRSAMTVIQLHKAKIFEYTDTKINKNIQFNYLEINNAGFLNSKDVLYKLFNSDETLFLSFNTEILKSKIAKQEENKNIFDSKLSFDYSEIPQSLIGNISDDNITASNIKYSNNIIESKNKFNINGPQKNINGDNFVYNLSTSDIIIKNNNGSVLPNQQNFKNWQPR